MAIFAPPITEKRSMCNVDEPLEPLWVTHIRPRSTYDYTYTYLSGYTTFTCMYSLYIHVKVV